jgi:regulator of protease activity HflC (stomatin/prohibitin superfamily)
MFISLAALIIAVKTVKIVPQSTVLLIERLGRFNRLAASGLNIIFPFIDKHLKRLARLGRQPSKRRTCMECVWHGMQMTASYPSRVRRGQR